MKLTNFCFFILLFCSAVFSQEIDKTYFSIEADYFYGSIIEHNSDISHLITKHPEGLTLSYIRKTFGLKEWERQYNAPDWGFTFIYQNMKNQILGENYSLYGHFNFYFLKRNLMFTIGQGIGYTTNPYDPDFNFDNNAYGSTILSTTFLKANYSREHIWKGLGFHAGFIFVHYSNANIKAPNTSTNTLGLNAGLSYQVDYKNLPEYITEKDGLDYSEKIKYNFIFRFGINESDIIGSGQFPFYVFSAFADKRLNYKSTVQFGVDVFLATFLEELINFTAVVFPEEGITGDEDYKRVGVFVGHELRFNKVAFVSQIGYYVYWPSKFENRVYLRLGLKRYFYKDKIFAAITLKSHWAKAEGVEFGIGIRL